jgi:hypothetical protein
MQHSKCVVHTTAGLIHVLQSIVGTQQRALQRRSNNSRTLNSAVDGS